jgi:hypothetical protein
MHKWPDGGGICIGPVDHAQLRLVRGRIKIPVLSGGAYFGIFDVEASDAKYVLRMNDAASHWWALRRVAGVVLVMSSNTYESVSRIMARA